MDQGVYDAAAVPHIARHNGRDVSVRSRRRDNFQFISIYLAETGGKKRESIKKRKKTAVPTTCDGESRVLHDESIYACT